MKVKGNVEVGWIFIQFLNVSSGKKNLEYGILPHAEGKEWNSYPKWRLKILSREAKPQGKEFTEKEVFELEQVSK